MNAISSQLIRKIYKAPNLDRWLSNKLPVLPALTYRPVLTLLLCFRKLVLMATAVDLEIKSYGMLNDTQFLMEFNGKRKQQDGLLSLLSY